MTLKFDPFGLNEAMLDMTERLAAKQIEGQNAAAAQVGVAFASVAADNLTKPVGKVLARKTDEMVKTPADMAQAVQEMTTEIMTQSFGWWMAAYPMTAAWLNMHNKPTANEQETPAPDK